MGCAFCDEGVLNRQVFFETEKEVVIKNIIPIVPSHCLVVPKRHVASISELDSEEIESLFSCVKRVSSKLKEHYAGTGFNVAFNDCWDAGQTVPHLHVHILIRKADDMDPDPRNLYYRIEKDRKRLSEEEMSNVVSDLKKVF